MKKRPDNHITEQPAAGSSTAFFEKGDSNAQSMPFFNVQSSPIRGSATGQGYDDPVHLQPAPAPAVALLTEDQINKAIRYNRFMYPPAQMRMLQNGLSVAVTGTSNRETALAVAQYQSTQGLTADGMAGPLTFAAIHADTSITGKDDLILFNVDVRSGIGLTTGGGTMNMLGQFNVDIHLPPGNCDDYEYRQYICGEVEFQAAGGTTFTSLNGIFTTQPGGSLPHIPNFHQDGNTTLGRRYGHRDRAATAENRYVDATGNNDQEHGCRFLGEDFPGITGRVVNTGEVYDFDLRFMGEVRHKTRGRVAERWWNIQDTFVI